MNLERATKSIANKLTKGDEKGMKKGMNNNPFLTKIK
jgi:hypothetical protein